MRTKKRNGTFNISIHMHNYKHKTERISKGVTKVNSKNNSLRFIFINLIGKVMLWFLAYIYI